MNLCLFKLFVALKEVDVCDYNAYMSLSACLFKENADCDVKLRENEISFKLFINYSRCIQIRKLYNTST